MKRANLQVSLQVCPFLNPPVERLAGLQVSNRSIRGKKSRVVFKGEITMPMDKTCYPPGWPKISRTIRRLAGNCCEWCGIANGAPLPSGRPGKVVLTVAHLGTSYANGQPGNKHEKHDVRRENLAALCQACHLRYDLPDHIQHAKETRHRKKYERAKNNGQLFLSW
jgi:hypothetical protein